jgi:hypothetical protein
MTGEVYPAFQGLVHLGRSAKARLSAFTAPWRARRKAYSYIRQLDLEIDRANNAPRSKQAEWGQIDGLILSAESSRTRAEDAYGIRDLAGVKSWAERGLQTMRTARSLMPDEISAHDT